MSGGDRESDGREVAAAQAAERFSLLLSGAATAADRSATETWRASDPAHEEAWLRVEAIWRGSLAVADDPTVLAMRRHATSSVRISRWQNWRPFALAASLMVAIGGSLWLVSSVMWPVVSPSSPFAEVANVDWSPVRQTRIGQIEPVRLSDGSVVTINTDSALRTAISSSARRVQIDRGEANFEVAKNARAPFSVFAGDLKVTAIGTSFSVRASGEAIIVTLAEGRVRVEAARSGKIADLEPGSRLRAVKGGFRIDRVDPGRATSWTSGMLDFERTPLGTVVGELNRYAEQRLVLRDQALAKLPITGVFPVGDQGRFAEMLSSNGSARIVRRTETTIELGRP